MVWKKGKGKSKSKGGRKKTFKRKARSTFNKTSVSVGLGFPKKMTMCHKYNEIITHTSSTGVATFYKFNCNGMYDPNNTSVGHQPYYYDQMSAIYDHYTVIGSKITIKVVPTSVPAVSFMVSLSQNDDATQTNNTIDGTAEQSNATSFIFPAGSTDTVKVLVNKWSAKKTFGGSILGNDNLQGTATSNPTEITLWSLGLRALDGVSTIQCYFDVKIEYIAVWDELRDIAQS